MRKKKREELTNSCYTVEMAINNEMMKGQLTEDDKKIMKETVENAK